MGKNHWPSKYHFDPYDDYNFEEKTKKQKNRGEYHFDFAAFSIEHLFEEFIQINNTLLAAAFESVRHN